MSNFITKLQTSEDAVKRRWLIATSAVAIVLVMVIWLMYFNALVQPNIASDASQGAQGIGFWQTFKGGFAVLAQSAKNGIRELVEKVKSPKTYDIESEVIKN